MKKSNYAVRAFSRQPGGSYWPITAYFQLPGTVRRIPRRHAQSGRPVIPVEQVSIPGQEHRHEIQDFLLQLFRCFGRGPPFGIPVFTVHNTPDDPETPVEQIFLATLPFIFAMLIVLLAVTYPPTTATAFL